MIKEFNNYKQEIKQEVDELRNSLKNIALSNNQVSTNSQESLGVTEISMDNLLESVGFRLKVELMIVDIMNSNTHKHFVDSTLAYNKIDKSDKEFVKQTTLS